jgi:radical SAM protein with 4Fe4S-binding SPASM domain
MESYLGDLTFIRFSAAGGSPKRYAEWQGAPEKDFFQMLTNLKDLVEIKRRKKLATTIGVTYPLFEGCEIDIIPFCKELRDIGVDYVQLKPCGDFRKCNYTYKKDTYREEAVAEQLREAEKLNTNDFYCQVKYERFHWLEVAEEHGLPEKCWGLLFYTQVGTDGKVYTCSGSWYEEENCYGSLADNTLKEIWESERFQEVFNRRSIVDKEQCFYQCRNIVGNSFLMKLKDPPVHINFV